MSYILNRKLKHSLLRLRLVVLIFQVVVPFMNFKIENQFVIAHKFDFWRAEERMEAQVLVRRVLPTVFTSAAEPLVQASRLLNDWRVRLAAVANMLFSTTTRVVVVSMKLSIDKVSGVFSAIVEAHDELVREE